MNNSAENLSEKARKAYFSLKSKIPYSNFISVEKWIKLFDSLITPIMTYGSEIWISEFKINFNVIHKKINVIFLSKGTYITLAQSIKHICPSRSLKTSVDLGQ
jgi:hypothetical protein